MSPITHFLVGWAVAGSVKLKRRDRILVTLAAVIPDIDGIGVVWDIIAGKEGFETYQRYHHVFGHNLFFGLLITVVSYMLAARKRITAALVLLSFHLHLLGDISGSRGVGDDFWAVPYFWPFSGRDYYWTGQWPLNGWQNFMITSILMAIMFHGAWKRGYSPLEMVSAKADQGLVGVLRRRFGNPGGLSFVGDDLSACAAGRNATDKSRSFSRLSEKSLKSKRSRGGRSDL